MMEKKNWKPDALIPLTILLAILSGIFIGVNYNKKINRQNRGMFFFSQPTGKTNQILEFINKSYVDSILVDLLEEDAIKGILRSLDPHSQYIPAANFSAVNESLEGNFSGIGIQYNMLNDTIVVVSTIAEGPSKKAGILAGDRIVMVEDMTVAGVKMPSDDIVNMLKGVIGSHVKVSVHRRGNAELIDFTITRDRIPINSIDAAYMITPETGYIKVNRFSRTTYQEFFEAAEKLRAEGMTNIMIDLRNNPGGIIDGAIKMSELFLPAGKLIVYTQGAKRGRINYYSAGRNNVYNNMELVLLIDETSASASEIVAGAVQDNDRGTIIGRRSFGKGLVQEQYELFDGSAIRLTVARYYTPTGRSIQKPYELNNNGDYYNELNVRIELGEMLEAENIRFNDSLKYVTPAGKVVYGGGGIMPDIFVPVDTTGTSNYYRTVMRRGMLYRFSFDYADKNRKILSEIPDYKSIQTFLKQKNILSEFIAYAEKQGVTKNDKDLNASGKHMENLVMAYIARNILDENGFYPIYNQMDMIVQKGLQALTSYN